MQNLGPMDGHIGGVRGVDVDGTVERAFMWCRGPSAD